MNDILTRGLTDDKFALLLNMKSKKMQFSTEKCRKMHVGKEKVQSFKRARNN